MSLPWCAPPFATNLCQVQYVDKIHSLAMFPLCRTWLDMCSPKECLVLYLTNSLYLVSMVTQCYIDCWLHTTAPAAPACWLFFQSVMLHTHSPLNALSVPECTSSHPVPFCVSAWYTEWQCIGVAPGTMLSLVVLSRCCSLVLSCLCCSLTPREMPISDGEEGDVMLRNAVLCSIMLTLA